MESFLEDYIENYIKDDLDATKEELEEEINYIRRCYENLETDKYRTLFNSIVLIKRYRGVIYREDISIIYRLSHFSNSNKDISNEYIENLYKNDYLTYDKFVAKYDKCTDKRDITEFALYLIDHLPAPDDIKIALKN